jgi:hypothetical protein
MSDAKPFQGARNNRFIVPERFRDGGKYVEDLWTGLLWQKDGEESGRKNFHEAAAYAKKLELEGIKQWRMPTGEELAAIFPATFLPFANTHYNTKECCNLDEEFPFYWTSELIDADSAALYQWYAGGSFNNGLTGANFGFVRCVHDPITTETSANAKRD